MQRLTLKQMILNEMDKQPRGYSEELAKIAGYSSGSNLKKVLKDEKKEFDKVNGLLKIVQTLFPDDELKLMSEYALTLDFNKHTARCMLEYVEINKQHNIRNDLINNMKECSNKQSQQYALIHEIDIRLASNEITYLEALALLENIPAKTPDVECLKAIYKSYCYIDVQLYDSVTLLLEVVLKNQNEIKDDFIRDIILGRAYLLLTECHLRKGNIELNRCYAKKLIKEVNNQLFQAWGCLHLGNSYILVDYDKANYYLNKSKMTFGMRNGNLLKNIKRSVNFLDNIWKKCARELDIDSVHPSDLHEIAFYYINNGQYEMATKTLNQEKPKDLSANQLAFHWYLRGLISNDISDFCKSVKYFKQSGDHHFSQLPLIELKKMNIQDCIIEVMAM